MSKEILRELFDYHPDGFFLYKKHRIKSKIGSPVYCFKKANGYKYVYFKRYMTLHRLIYIWHHGDQPDFIDHIDRDRENNRIENLRPATPSLNNMNKVCARGRSKYRGVSWCERAQNWKARIQYEGKSHSLGRYKTEIDAATAYNIKAFELLGDGVWINR